MVGVMPEDVPDLRKHLDRMGVQGVEVKENGNLRIDSRGAYKKYCEATGFVMKNGGYGDATQTKYEGEW
jgi:hypothetical protein